MPTSDNRSYHTLERVDVSPNLYRSYQPPQEEVAQVTSRYNIMAVLVVDQLLRLVGIITVDDVIDVIREENTEDMLKMSGAGEIDLASWSILKNTRARLPRLFASFIGGILAAYIIGNFETQTCVCLSRFHSNYHGDER